MNQSTSVVNYRVTQQIGIIEVNYPPVNALSFAVRTGIIDAVQQAQSDDSKALILICAGKTFIAGADISEFSKPPQSPMLPDMLEVLKASKKILVAAIHGTALGGGLETALCCHYRMALDSAKVGLPEVKLGILPGAGGTQRLPRLAGVIPSLEIMTRGNPITASKALSLNILDKVVDADTDLLTAAIEYAQQLLEKDAPLRDVDAISIDPATAPSMIFEQARIMAKQQAKGMISPLKIIDCVEAATKTTVPEGLKIERDLFMQCLMSPQSAALQHLFFAERQVTKIKGMEPNVQPKTINSIGVIGAGLMGGGIAMNFINVGIPVVLLDVDEAGLKKGVSTIEGNYARTVKKGRLSEDDAKQRLALLSPTTDYAKLADVDLVIEAVFENLELKKTIFAQLDKVCKLGAVLASNTSYQNIDELATVTSRPKNVCGMHFFSPANIMKLLEVVRATQSSDETIATAMAVGKRIRKVTVLSGLCYGFIANRMFNGYMRESQLCLLEGASPQQIDKALEDWGMAMGSIAVADLAGLDIGYKARQNLPADSVDPKTVCVVDRLVNMGKFGQKTGSGFYHYDPETRKKLENPDLNKIIEEEAERFAISRREFSDQEIIDRHILPLINEGAHILEEGIAQRPGDIDIIYIYGYGFAPAQGGPMHYADSIGLAEVYKRLCELEKAHGEHWKPAPLVKQLAEQNSSFKQWDKAQG